MSDIAQFVAWTTLATVGSVLVVSYVSYRLFGTDGYDSVWHAD